LPPRARCPGGRRRPRPVAVPPVAGRSRSLNSGVVPLVPYKDVFGTSGWRGHHILCLVAARRSHSRRRVRSCPARSGLSHDARRSAVRRVPHLYLGNVPRYHRSSISCVCERSTSSPRRHAQRKLPAPDVVQTTSNIPSRASRSRATPRVSVVRILGGQYLTWVNLVTSAMQVCEMSCWRSTSSRRG
jgi:hypothetical protein